MSYDFKSADGGVLSTYPNPFKIENWFLILGAGVFLIAGFSCVNDARTYFQLLETKAAVASSGLGVFLIGLGAKLLIRGLSQLRFWMGQHYPFGLAGSTFGNTPYGEDSEYLAESLRQQTIQFPEPVGPLNGVLYSLAPKLIVAPPVLQHAAQQHFAALCNALVLSLSMLISWTMFAGLPHEGLMSWFYLPLSGLSLYQLFRSKQNTPIASAAVINRGLMVAVFSVLATVLLPMAANHLPPLHLSPMWSACFAVQAGTIVASCLFLLAVNSQIDAAEQTGVACEMHTVAMNCMPAQLWTEIARDFQRNWVQEIPNRQYINALPKTLSGDRGEFRGEILEETQPMPKDRMVFSGFTEALKTRHGRVLVAMSTFGLLFIALSAFLAFNASSAFGSIEAHQIWTEILLVVATSSTAVACIAGGHLLWSRMHFKSRITWIEMDGTFQRAMIDVGNTFRGNVKSSSTITRIEDATIRVWSAELETVVFGKDGHRAVIGMSPLPTEAVRLSNHLRDFAASQSSIAAPTSMRDVPSIERIAELGQSMSSSIRRMNAEKSSLLGQA